MIIDDAAKGMLADPHSYELFYDLMPHLLENPRMATQLAQLYRAYRELNTWGFWGDPSDHIPDVVRDLAAMTVALTDGLAIQLLAEPGSVDVTRALGVWRSFVEGILATTPGSRSRGAG